MWGVSVITMSVSVTSLRLWAKSLPRTGRLARPGRPEKLVRSASLMRPARMFVSPSRSRITLVTWRLLNVGRFCTPATPTDCATDETSSFSTSVTSLS